MKYIDTHAHINTEYFKEDLKETLRIAKEYNVDTMIMPSTNLSNSLKSIEMAKRYDFLYAAVGLHPADTYNVEECSYLNKINPDDIVAIGEVGIDLYRDENPPLEIQQKVFEKHIQFAKKHNKVLIIHMRDAEEEVYNIIKKYVPMKFVMHSYTASYAWALKFLDLGGYISFSGIVTFKNAPDLKEVAKKIPLDRIITETDAPFLTPVPLRGKPNTPGYVRYTTDYVASIRQEKDEDVVKQIYNTAIKLFLDTK